MIYVVPMQAVLLHRHMTAPLLTVTEFTNNYRLYRTGCLRLVPSSGVRTQNRRFVSHLRQGYTKVIRK